MSVNRCIGSGPKLRRTGSIRGWGEHVATIGDEVVFNALEDDGVSGNWSCLLVVDDVHVNSCRLMIGVDIVCGGERLADDVVVCRRTAAVRLSMLCCCLTSIYCQFAPALCWWRLFALEYRIACCSVRKLVNLKVFASLLYVLMAVVEQAKLLLSERVVLVIPEILAKTGTDLWRWSHWRWGIFTVSLVIHCPFVLVLIIKP